ncbi:MAG: hypothetical protein HMLKMBBP_03635 [Planctomycetes bacterium]|nr:hypothetical protein [Planctomycetota bacterium]
MSDDRISGILRAGTAYPRDAFEFVESSLRVASHRAAADAAERRHVSAAELLDAFRDLAREAFGPLARTVLSEWNVHTTRDVGRIVFLMVEAGEMGKTDDDDEADFADGFAFEDAFPAEPGPASIPRDADPEVVADPADDAD